MVQHVFTHKGAYDFASNEVDYFTNIYALFLNESSLVIRVKRKREGLNGGYFYKTLRSNVYKVYTNKHGQKYLRSFRETENGLFFSDDLQQMKEDSFLYTNAVSRSDPYGRPKDNLYCEEMIKLIEDHLSVMLGFPFERKACPRLGVTNRNEEESVDGSLWTNTPDFLCYPFLRNKDNRDFATSLLQENDKLKTTDITEILALNWKGARGLTYALRNSQSKENFVQNIVYKSAVKTEEDVSCLVENPSFLRVFAQFDLKMGAREATDRGYATVFKDAPDYMDVQEIFSFQFLLKYLPKQKVEEVLDLASRLASFRLEQQRQGLVNDLNGLVKIRASKFFSPLNNWRKNLWWYFHSIAPSGKQGFAVSFWKEFTAEYVKTEPQYSLLSSLPETVDNRAKCFTAVMDAYIRAYSAVYLELLPANSLESCSATAMELFGVDLSEDKSLKSDTVAVKQLNVTVSFYDFRQQVSKRLHRDDRKNLFYMIRMQADTRDMWGLAFCNPSNIVFGDYAHMQFPTDLILASDLELILRKIAAKVDASLVKLGREITSKNRMIYLEASSHARKFNVNWRYYDLGVPVDEVPLYKKAGFKSKRDILFWLETKESLPDGMYQELLKDAANGASDRTAQTLSF